MDNVVDIRGLAIRTGADPESIHLAGRELFIQLSGNEPDLAKALIKASAASDLEPGTVLSILQVLAEVFQEPLGEAPSASPIAKGIADFASAASEGAQSATAKARDVLSAINLSDVREKGEDLAAKLRDEVSEIDIDGLKDRAGSARDHLLEKARSLARPFRNDAKKQDQIVPTDRDL